MGDRGVGAEGAKSCSCRQPQILSPSFHTLAGAPAEATDQPLVQFGRADLFLQPPSSSKSRAPAYDARPGCDDVGAKGQKLDASLRHCRSVHHGPMGASGLHFAEQRETVRRQKEGNFACVFLVSRARSSRPSRRQVVPGHSWTRFQTTRALCSLSPSRTCIGTYPYIPSPPVGRQAHTTDKGAGAWHLLGYLENPTPPFSLSHGLPTAEDPAALLCPRHQSHCGVSLTLSLFPASCLAL